MPTAKTGQWYHCATCHRCKHWVVIGAAASPAQRLVGGGTVTASCQNCGKANVFQVAEIAPRQVVSKH